MARGSKIIVTSSPKGAFVEGYAGDSSFTPGICMQIQAAVAMKNGRFTYIAAAPGADSVAQAPLILLDDELNGFGVSDTPALGQRIRMYAPLTGEEINVRCGEVAGTGNTYAIGDKLINDAEDGLYVPAASSPSNTPFQVLETVTQVAGVALVWCMKT